MTVHTLPARTAATDTAAADAPATDSAVDAAVGVDAEAGSEAAAEVTDQDDPVDAGDPDADRPRRGRPKGSTARRTRVVELTLTVSGTADGDWQAELRHGSTWVARGLPVTAAAVSRAAKELHDDLAGPIDEVIHAARRQQEAKVAALEAELERARKALAELAD